MTGARLLMMLNEAARSRLLNEATAARLLNEATAARLLNEAATRLLNEAAARLLEEAAEAGQMRVLLRRCSSASAAKHQLSAREHG
jgi:hypothetical protein